MKWEKRVNWDKVREFEKMIKDQGLKLAEGSRKFWDSALAALCSQPRQEKMAGRQRSSKRKMTAQRLKKPVISNTQEQDRPEKKTEWILRSMVSPPCLKKYSN